MSTSNLSGSQFRALRKLRQMDDIIVKMSDKGGTVTVLNRSDYQSYMESMLEDRYLHLSSTHGKSN